MIPIQLLVVQSRFSQARRQAGAPVTGKLRAGGQLQHDAAPGVPVALGLPGQGVDVQRVITHH